MSHSFYFSTPPISSKNIKIENCIISRNYLAGIIALESTGVYIQKNNISSNTYTDSIGGVCIENTSFSQIYDNILYLNKVGIFVKNGSWIEIVFNRLKDYYYSNIRL
ncbi:MAG: right-handed parallel beta-helix repeat-containing protein [Thermoplasmata archaeon]